MTQRGTLVTTRTFVDNLLFSVEDPYERMTYYAYRNSDAEQVRVIRGAVPSYTLADFAAVNNETRDSTANALKNTS